MRSLRLVLCVLLLAAGANAATFTVTTNADAGAGSLRQVIADLNATGAPSGNTIAFAIGSGVATIRPGSQLPAINKPVVIDGTTQPGYSGTPIIEIDGADATVPISGVPRYNIVGLRLQGGFSTVKGLVMNNWNNHTGTIGLAADAALSLASSNNTVTGCWFGLDLTGEFEKHNDVGVRIEQGANNSMIGGNTTAARNIFTGDANGVESDWGSVWTTGTIIRGNWFSLTASGKELHNYMDTDLDRLDGGVIGGTGPGDGNTFAGLVVIGGSRNVLVQGNHFGVNGMYTHGGIFLGHADSITIGGTAPGAGNTFLNTYQEAIGIQKSANNVVQGNTLTNVETGIIVSSADEPGTANNNTIGGTADGAGNTIRNATNMYWGGVDVFGATGTRILRNSISGSAGTGINLGTGGHGYPTACVPTPNDPGDGDTGPNNLQNYPVIATATSGNGSTTIAGTLNSTPFGSYRVEFFANTACDSTGYGEGETYLGFTNVTTDGSGNGSFLATVTTTVSPGRVITSTATDSTGNTSEFSACTPVTGSGMLTFSSATSSVGEGAGNAALTVSRVSGALGTVTINFATANGTATAGSDYTAAAGTLTFGDGETSKTINVPIVQDSNYEGNEAFTATLSSPGGGALLGPPTTTTVTIVDDDQPSYVSIADVRVTEGNSGTTNAVFNVTLSAALSSSASVQWATASGTATAGVDFQSASGTVTFAAGETQKTITVGVVGDPSYEPDETFSVTLSNPVNTLLQRATAIGTIANDDVQPTVSADDVRVVEGNSGTTTATITLTANQPLTSTVNFNTVAGTALPGNDFTATAGSVTFNNETQKQITIPIVVDSAPEADEQFKVHLSSPDAFVLFAHPDVTVTIVNDDVAVTPATLMLATGKSGNFLVDVGNPVSATQTLTVSTSSACIKAPASADIAAGLHTASIQVTAVTAPCDARIDFLLPPALGGATLSAGVKTYQGLTLTFDPASPQIFVGQSISVVVTATPFSTPVTLALSAASGTVDVPPTVEVGASGGSFTMHAVQAGPIFVEVTLPPQYGGSKISYTGNVVETPPTVTILDVTPKSGAQVGGTPVAISGTNFTADCTIDFDGAAASNVAFLSPTRITAIAPAHKPGASDVTATCGGHSSTLKNGFIYTGGAPDITSVTPASGTTLGGTTVRIGGRDLTSDCWVDFGGMLAFNVNVVSATEMIATTPPNAAGAVTVKLRCNGDAAGSLPRGFTYVTAEEPSPVVTSVEPASAAPGQQVTVNGAHFRVADGVTFESAPAHVLATTPETHVVVVPPLPSGKASVTVASSTTGPLFTVLDPDAPKITKFTPSVVPPGAELLIDGSGFRAPYTFTIGGVAVRLVTMSYTHAVVRVPALSAGQHEIDVVNGGAVAANGGNVTIATNGMIVAGAAPLCVVTDGGTLISITGSGFAPGAAVTIGGVAALSATVVDASHIDARTPALPPGFAAIVVTNPSGDNASATNAVRVYSPYNPDGCGVSRPRPVH